MEDSGIGELLARMIAIDTQNPGGSERKLAETIADELRNVPCRCWIQPVDGGRRANVFAHIEGWSEEGALVLNGHLDTVPNGGISARFIANRASYKFKGGAIDEMLSRISAAISKGERV